MALKLLIILLLNMVTIVAAVSECSELHPKASLITIESEPEQEFVNTILATYSHETDKVWTGMTNAINGANFQNWHDDEPVSWGMHALFNNRFQEVVADYCVQISTNNNFLGKWYSEPCVRRAYALCARPQEWTIEILSDAMENMTKLVNSQQLIINENNVTLLKLNELNSLLINKLESDYMQRDAPSSGNLGYKDLEAYNYVSASGHCTGGWTSYHDQKCFKIIDSVIGTAAEGMAACAKEDPKATLPTVWTAAENQFIYDMIKPYATKALSAWLGILHQGTTITWVDKSAMSYQNYVYTGQTHQECIQMYNTATIFGAWVDGPCTGRGLTVCQRIVHNCPNYMPQLLATNKKVTTAEAKLADAIKQFDEQIAGINNLLTVDYKDMIDIIKNPVPINFVYTQLPGTDEPGTLWKNVKFEEVSDKYPGLFFRVEGQGSGAFGAIQEANFTGVEIIRTKQFEGLKYKSLGKVTDRSLSLGKWLVEGGKELPATSCLVNMYRSNIENRPKNVAVKIWKRSE
ncbi:unnamed protein product [Medioppia subpectinata]|uniref:C-type lectin domain-containing protein n=1 Tax=Medioppia subpectinata TaxID=1979941 RepID=A0A7R9KJG6_9ACAR|nr:unnamed protein product [Medioppia subpectinata]CAG2103508.1 unnamed protein product [Medioppia subpectinata]